VKKTLSEKTVVFSGKGTAMMIEWQLVLRQKMISVMRTAGNTSQRTPLSINISSLD